MQRLESCTCNLCSRIIRYCIYSLLDFFLFLSFFLFFVDLERKRRGKEEGRGKGEKGKKKGEEGRGEGRGERNTFGQVMTFSVLFFCFEDVRLSSLQTCHCTALGVGSCILITVTVLH